MALTKAGLLVLDMASDTAPAAMLLPCRSVMAPASTIKRGADIAFTVLVSALPKSNFMELVPFVTIKPLDRVMPPEFWPVSRMCILEASCAALSRVALNATSSVPLPV